MVNNVQIKINYFVVNIMIKLLHVIYLSENGPKQNKKVDPLFLWTNYGAL